MNYQLIGNARNQGNCLKYLENCQNSRVIKLGPGVKKKNLLQLLGQTICQTFLFLIYFALMRQSFLKTKISFNRYCLRLLITQKSSL